MFVEGCEPDALHMFSKLKHTKSCEVNTIILRLFHYLIATLTFHWQTFPPLVFHLSCSLCPEHLPLLPWLPFLHPQGLSLHVTFLRCNFLCRRASSPKYITICNCFVCMFFLTLSPPSSIELHSEQGPSLSLCLLFYLSVPSQLAPSKCTIKHLLDESVN